MTPEIDQHYFDSYGTNGYFGTEHFTDYDVECLLNHIQTDFGLSIEGTRMLEVGSGAGLCVSKMRQRGVDAQGIELFEPMVARTLEGARGFNRVGDIRSIPLPDDSVDVILTTAICYIEESELPLAFGELARVGRFLILWPATVEWLEENRATDTYSKQLRTRADWAALAVQHGWRQVPCQWADQQFELFERRGV